MYEIDFIHNGTGICIRNGCVPNNNISETETTKRHRFIHSGEIHDPLLLNDRNCAVW